MLLHKQAVHLYPPSDQILFLDQSLPLVAVLETIITTITPLVTLAQLAAPVGVLPEGLIRLVLALQIKVTAVVHLAGNPGSGGGGAGAVGGLSDLPLDDGGSGGNGVSSSITGSAVTRPVAAVVDVKSALRVLAVQAVVVMAV